jgi:hypothetical protein
MLEAATMKHPVIGTESAVARDAEVALELKVKEVLEVIREEKRRMKILMQSLEQALQLRLQT